MPHASGVSRRIQRHISNLNSPQSNVSSRAEEFIIRYYGGRALEPLLEACNHSNPVVRFRAVWALAYTQDPRAYETILRLTDDPDERVRYDATMALGILGDERATEPLTRMYLTNDISRPAGEALHRMGIRAVPALTEVLRQGSPEVRLSVTNVLGGFAKESGDPQSAALLQVCASDPEPAVRENVAFWLDEVRKGKVRPAQNTAGKSNQAAISL